MFGESIYKLTYNMYSVAREEVYSYDNEIGNIASE